MLFLIINKGSGETYHRDTLEEVAFIVENETTEKGKALISDLRWSLKRTGRWDREDGIVVVIPATLKGEDE